jgi:hypothetical protein
VALKPPLLARPVPLPQDAGYWPTFMRVFPEQPRTKLALAATGASGPESLRREPVYPKRNSEGRSKCTSTARYSGSKKQYRILLSRPRPRSSLSLPHPPHDRLKRSLLSAQLVIVQKAKAPYRLPVHPLEPLRPCYFLESLQCQPTRCSLHPCQPQPHAHHQQINARFNIQLPHNRIFKRRLHLGHLKPISTTHNIIQRLALQTLLPIPNVQ